MGKKNPYVTTIGFDRTDPRHVQVAELLNGMTRKKAQYIVDAVLAYNGTGQKAAPAAGVDFESIRAIVLQVLAEQGKVQGGFSGGGAEAADRTGDSPSGEPDGGIGIDVDDLEGIMRSLQAFRE